MGKLNKVTDDEIVDALLSSQGNKNQASLALGVSRVALWKRIDNSPYISETIKLKLLEFSIVPTNLYELEIHEVLELIYEHFGNIFLISKALQCPVRAVYEFVRDNELQSDLDIAKQQIPILAEATLIESFKKGNFDLAKWYIERQERETPRLVDLGGGELIDLPR